MNNKLKALEHLKLTMEHKIEKLEEVKFKLINWRAYDEMHLQQLIKEFEKTPRQEFSSYYIPILTDKLLVKKLVEIGEAFQFNSNIAANIISSLGNIVWRYKFNPPIEVFNFMKNQIKNKKVNYYVSLYISCIPQFHSWEEKWDYLLSIPLIAPRKKSISNFHVEVKNMLNRKDRIPLEVRERIIDILSFYRNSEGLSVYSKKDYLNTICLLKELKQ